MRFDDVDQWMGGDQELNMRRRLMTSVPPGIRPVGEIIL
jgi:hypothetical protein